MMNTLRFQGSRERLHRIVSRSNGKWMADRHFEITMRASSRNDMGACFVFRCVWSPLEGGCAISYRCFPTVFSILRYLLAFAFFAAPGIYTVLNSPGALTVLLLLPLIVVAAYLRSHLECIRDFRKLFSAPTH